jgi:hypothetical protein
VDGGEDRAERAVDARRRGDEPQRPVGLDAEAEPRSHAGALDRLGDLGVAPARLPQEPAQGLAEGSRTAHVGVVGAAVDGEPARAEPVRERRPVRQELGAAEVVRRVHELLDEPQPARRGGPVGAAMAREVGGKRAARRHEESPAYTERR